MATQNGVEVVGILDSDRSECRTLDFTLSVQPEDLIRPATASRATGLAPIRVKDSRKPQTYNLVLSESRLGKDTSTSWCARGGRQPEWRGGSPVAWSSALRNSQRSRPSNETRARGRYPTPFLYARLRTATLRVAWSSASRNSQRFSPLG